MKIPSFIRLLNLAPTNMAPISMVKNGVNAFNTPVTELSIRVCAKGNRNAGIKLPRNPLANKKIHCFRVFICRKFRMAIGSRNNEAEKILSAAISAGSNAASPFFIKNLLNFLSKNADIYSVILLPVMPVFRKWLSRLLCNKYMKSLLFLILTDEMMQ